MFYSNQKFITNFRQNAIGKKM